MTTHHTADLPALTGIRFFAAAAVLLSHFTALGLIALPVGFLDFVDGGRTAVSLFFVLSGFILTYNYSQLFGSAESQRFWAARFARVWPTTVLAVAVGAISVGYAVTHLNERYLLDWFSLTPSNATPSLVVSLLSQLTMTTGWLPAASLNQAWNGPAWSIACEAFFYALFPFLVVRLRLWSNRRLVWLVTLGMLAQGLFIIFVRAVAPIGQRGFLVSQFPITHLLEFVAGICTALLFARVGHNWLRQGYRRSIAIFGALLAIAMLSWLRPIDPAFFLLTPFFCVLIAGLAVPTRAGNGGLMSKGPLPLLGEASFALYMLHVPLAHLLILSGVDTPWMGWIAVGGLVAFTIGIFQRFETPCRKWLRPRLSPRDPARSRTAPSGR